MRRALIALALAVLIVGASVLCFLAFEPALGPAFAFWPGFAAQRFLEALSVSATNRILFLPTLLFWWLVVWLVLRFGLPRLPVLSNSAAHPEPLKRRSTWHPLSRRPGGRER